MPKQVNPDVETFARISVVGVGGSGGNAINHMIEKGVKGVEFIAINTDAQDLHHSEADQLVHIGKNLTRGLGTGMNPELGKRAAEETKEEIQGTIKGADMVFITCGMGGGTGTGAAPVVAQVARDLGALTVGVVTKPFFFEGEQRKQLAQEGLRNLQQSVDALIVIPNDKLLQTVDKETTAEEAFSMCDEILREAVEGISDLITMPGIINVDFADIRSVMESAGSALMGVGRASGDTRAQDAATLAINSPLLDVSVDGAKGVLFAVAGSENVKMHEVQEAAKVITESIDKNSKVIFGAFNDDSLKKGEIRVTVIATGFPKERVIEDSSSSLFDFDNQDEDSFIYNEVPHDDAPNPDMFEEPRETVEGNRQGREEQEEDDDWSAVPAFLRRSKKKKNDDNQNQDEE